MKFVSVDRYPPGIGPNATRILLCSAWTEQQPSKPIAPQFSFRFFSFLSPVFGECPPKHSLDQGSKGSIVQRAIDQGRRWSEMPLLLSFSTRPWPSRSGEFIVHCSPVFQCSAVRSIPPTTGSVCMFHIVIDRADLCAVRSVKRAIGSVSTSTSRKRRHMACCCVCMQVNAHRMHSVCELAERVETKTKRVFFFSRRSWFSFVVGLRSALVRSYDHHLPKVFLWLNFTPDPQRVHAEWFSFRPSMINPYTPLFDHEKVKTKHQMHGRHRVDHVPIINPLRTQHTWICVKPHIRLLAKIDVFPTMQTCLYTVKW